MEDIETTPAPLPTPEATGAEDAMTRAMAKAMSPKAQDALAKSRGTKVKPEKPAAPTPAPEEKDDDNVISFDEEVPSAEEEKPAEAPAEDDGAESLKKRLTEKDKENAKIRKRAQEAEAKATAHEASIAEVQAKLDAALQERDASRTRPNLSGNAYAHITDPSIVEAWADNAQKALRTLQKAALNFDQDRTHKFPNGEERELTADDLDMLESRVEHAKQWHGAQQDHSKALTEAKPILEKLKAIDGFTKAHDAILSTDWVTQWPIHAAKAALYDAMVAGKGKIIFPGKAGAAINALSDTEAQSPGKASKTTSPTPEIASTAPRIARADDGTSTARSEFKQRAMKSGSRDDVIASIKASARARVA